MGELACLKQGPGVTAQHVRWMAWQAGQGLLQNEKYNRRIRRNFRKQNKKTKEVENRKVKSLRRNLNINYEKMSLKLKDMYFYMEGILSTINDKRLVYQGISLCDKVHDLSWMLLLSKKKTSFWTPWIKWGLRGKNLHSKDQESEWHWSWQQQHWKLENHETVS